MYRNQKIILLHSEEEGKVPENLELGELAVNCAKDNEFICLKNTDNQMIKIAPNGGGTGKSNKNNPFKLVQGFNKAIVTETNNSNINDTLTLGYCMQNNSGFSFAFGWNQIDLVPISINGKHLKLNRNTSQPVCEGYYDGAIIVDKDGNHISDLVSYNYENDGYILDIEVSNEFDFQNGPKFMLLKSNDGGSYNFNFGINNHLKGSILGVFGINNYASGTNNYVFGNTNIGNGNHNIICGKNNKTEGNFNILQGEKNRTNGRNNLIIGTNNDIVGNNGIYAGQFLEGNGHVSSVFGMCNDASNSYILAVGNGYPISESEFKRHNSLSINTNGEIMIQEDITKVVNSEIKYPPMISLQSLVTRIKTLEEEVNRLKNK